MFCGGICCVGCCSGVSDIGWVVMVVVVMVGYLGCWWYSDVFGGDDNCGNGGSCD